MSTLLRTQNPVSIPGRFLIRFWSWISVFLAAELSILVVNSLLALVYKKFTWRFEPEIHLTTLLLAACILGTIRMYNQKLDERMPWSEDIGRRLLAQLLSNVGITLFFTIVVRNLLILFNTLFHGTSTFVRLQDEVIISLVVSFFTLLVVLVDLGIFLMQQWKSSATEAARFKQENLEFRFDRLKNQVNPHFLFNSLNTLASLVYNDPETASGFIRQLAKVYRYVLENRDKEVITLAEELNFMEAYLYLVKIRFDDGIRFELDIPAECQSLSLPPMTLQLLIENALKHNVVSASKPLSIKIKGKGDRLEVSNNLQPKISPEPSTKTGLENIKNRYAFLTQNPVNIVKTEKLFSVDIPLLSSSSNL
ncbi:MAG TPA: histidine kinase [Catalimonadaceae bacterium]|nr:histidine kinase [Catalimonadaceae bacterium]HPI09438.1 histidine kinase [Catalimonadaceae bacterium]